MPVTGPSGRRGAAPYLLLFNAPPVPATVVAWRAQTVFPTRWLAVELDGRAPQHARVRLAILLILPGSCTRGDVARRVPLLACLSGPRAAQPTSTPHTHGARRLYYVCAGKRKT